MPYLMLDDKFPNNPKVAALSDRAFRLHVLALCHCSKHLTDGFVSVSSKLWGELGSNRRRTAELVRAKLWVEVEGGWQVHDYLDYNASAAQIKEKQRKDRARKRTRVFTDSERNPDGNDNGFHADSTGSAYRESSKELSLSGEPAKSGRQRRTKPAAPKRSKNLERAIAFVRNAGCQYTDTAYNEEIERFDLTGQQRHELDRLRTELQAHLNGQPSGNGDRPDMIPAGSFHDTEPEDDDEPF